jgi:hypothetical protein
VPYVDKVKSVKNTGVSQPRWVIWREIWKWSCIPSLLYCISQKNVDTEYMYYSWCMTSTDIVKWRKNEWLWKFWKRNDLHENFEKRGGGGNETHAPCACVGDINKSKQNVPIQYVIFRLIQYKREGMQLHFHISCHIAHLGWETPVFFTLFTTKKKICVFTVTRLTLIFASDPMHFYTEFG